MLTHYDERQLPDGQLCIAEEHTTTDSELQAAIGRLCRTVDQRHGRPVRWIIGVAATEGEQPQGGDPLLVP